MKKYMSRSVSLRIEEVEIDRETESSVWINGSRVAKIGVYGSYHDTWEEAHQRLLALAQRDVDTLRRRLELANSRLGNIKGMKKP